MIPASCCIIDDEKYPKIEPYDSHCVYVPTKYNSHWSQVGTIFINDSLEWLFSLNISSVTFQKNISSLFEGSTTGIFCVTIDDNLKPTLNIFMSVLNSSLV